MLVFVNLQFFSCCPIHDLDPKQSIDPHQFEKSDPDPYGNALDPQVEDAGQYKCSVGVPGKNRPEVKHSVSIRNGAVKHNKKPVFTVCTSTTNYNKCFRW